jgi:hypothetical protein
MLLSNFPTKTIRRGKKSCVLQGESLDRVKVPDRQSRRDRHGGRLVNGTESEMIRGKS